jgi:hypothetical protein
LVSFGMIGLIVLLYFKVTGSFSSVLSQSTGIQLGVAGQRQKTDDQLLVYASEIEQTTATFFPNKDLIINIITSLCPADLTQLYNLFGLRVNGITGIFNKTDLIAFLRDALSSDQFNSISGNLQNAGIL